MQGELLLLGLRKKLFGALEEIVLGLRRDIVTDDMEKARGSSRVIDLLRDLLLFCRRRWRKW
jgi:hypothetical protein